MERFYERNDLVDVDGLGMGRIVLFGGSGMVLLVFSGSPLPRWIREDQILHLSISPFLIAPEFVTLLAPCGRLSIRSKPVLIVAMDLALKLGQSGLVSILSRILSRARERDRSTGCFQSSIF